MDNVEQKLDIGDICQEFFKNDPMNAGRLAAMIQMYVRAETTRAEKKGYKRGLLEAIKVVENYEPH